MSSDEVSLDIFDPAPEQLHPVELFQLEKAAQIFFFLVVSHALRDEQALLVSEPASWSAFIENSVVDQLVNLLRLRFSHKGLSVSSEAVS